MQLEDYFEFDACDRIRVKGTRMAIEFLIEPYLDGESPEYIFRNFRHSVTLEQVYATITYYLHNKKEIDAYMERNRVADEAAYQEYLKKEPSEVVKRLRAIREQQQGSKVAG
jgi:uncharacterized protein (DUF433 family)